MSDLLAPFVARVDSHELPLFLCPALLPHRLHSPRKIPHSAPHQSRGLYGAQLLRAASRSLYTQSNRNIPSAATLSPLSAAQLPPQCPGCGALSQTTNKDVAGYYNTSRKVIRDRLFPIDDPRVEQTQTVNAALASLDPKLLESLSLDSTTKDKRDKDLSKSAIICDRCHRLQYHQEGVSIHHPTIEAIADTIFETPYKYNHVYHVIDAADFPMSLIPGIHKTLHLTPQRSQNRRARDGGFYHGRRIDVSFIITRSDLLAPLKEQVDHMMPYFTEVLRDALGSYGKDVRLGNIRCVSAKRGWWTTSVKEEVWRRGEGGWMVGKVNVGKSQLLESIFPKGRRNNGTRHVLQRPMAPLETSEQVTNGMMDQESSPRQDVDDPLFVPLNESALLPPAPVEVDYPPMPLVSSLPGTTASPIRLLFGNGKGELVDMPGLARGDLELHVQPEHRQSLVMKSRIIPEQEVIKPGQSLLLGGLIRITPTTPDTVFLAYPFMPIESHVTSTEKALAIQARERDTTVENIGNEGVSSQMASAGRFQLKWDVTKLRTGPLTRKSDVNLKTAVLPYVVYAADILIEGCGWVEITAQVRRRQMEHQDLLFPEVEIFSPLGKYIGIRRPMNAYMLNKKIETANAKGRPRRSMKGMKKKEKLLARARA